MSKKLNRIVMTAAGLAGVGLGGCNGEALCPRVNRPSVGALIAGSATVNALNAAQQGDFRRANAYAGLAEYGRAEAAREAAIAGRSEQTVIVNAGSGNEGGRGGRERSYNDNSGIVVLQLGDCVYRGEVWNGKPHGTGKLQYPNGSWFEGEYRRGKREGFGRLTDSEGCFWEGMHKNDVPTGIIIFTSRYGTKRTQYYNDEGEKITKEEFEEILKSGKTSGR